MLKANGLICSMSRKGNCWDNAVAESFFNSLKTELIYHENYASRETAKQNVFHYIEVYYNKIRRHSAVGLIPLMAYENQFKKIA
jgi:transposase InsO family protein